MDTRLMTKLWLLVASILVSIYIQESDSAVVRVKRFTFPRDDYNPSRYQPSARLQRRNPVITSRIYEFARPSPQQVANPNYAYNEVENLDFVFPDDPTLQHYGIKPLKEDDTRNRRLAEHLAKVFKIKVDPSTNKIRLPNSSELKKKGYYTNQIRPTF